MIRAEKIAITLGSFRLRGLDLAVAKGEHFVILGPPGAGKTVFVECLLGLRRIDEGRVFVNGREVTRLEPRARRIGYVPQDYALFPHLTVVGNIAFGLRRAGLGRREAAARAAAAARMLGIDHLLRRSVPALSGGERQRVALARALVLEPDALVLDEPVSALDESTRQEVLDEIRGIRRDLGVTILHISHNLEEAFALADRAGILSRGAFEQVGTVGEIVQRPRNEFVARFMRCGNILGGAAGEFRGEDRGPGSTRVAAGGVELAVPGRHEGEVRFVVRPENVILAPRGAAGGERSENEGVLPRSPAGGAPPPGRGDGTQPRDGRGGARVLENAVPLRFVRARDLGNYVRVELKGTFDIVAHLSPSAFAALHPVAGAELLALLPREKIHVLEA